MTNDKDAGQLYAAAHHMHYDARDLPEALSLYERIILVAPGSTEASYARTQIHNMLKSVVAESRQLAANVALLHDCFEQRGNMED